MKNIYIIILLIVFGGYSYSQSQNPKFLDDLPLSTGYEHVGHKDLHVGNKGSELFFANIDDSTSLGYIKTENFPDCLLAVNKFGGNDIYKKLKSGGFQRIIQVKKIDGAFKVFYVDNDNESYNLVLTTEEKDGHTIFSATLLGYTLYWNNLLK
ncbi:MAG: hypothetical protein NT048_03900 [Flavobacterium sp.]|nr:hypothetical protein [Flavobacterium sp.]